MPRATWPRRCALRSTDALRRAAWGVVLALALVLPARAQVESDVDGVCHYGVPDRAIPACTALIESESTPRAFLPDLYYRRAINYSLKTQYDRALADYD